MSRRTQASIFRQKIEDILKNLRTRLFITYLVLILFSISLMGILFYFLTKEHLLKNKAGYLGSSAEVFIKFITPFLETEDDLAAASRFFLRQCWEQLDYQLQVIDSKGDIVADSRGLPVSAGKGDKKFLTALEGRESAWPERSPEGQKMCRAVPIRLNDRIIGAVKLTVSLKEFDSLFAVMRKYFFLTFFFSLFIAVLAALFFIQTLLKPLSRIRDTAVKIARGDLDSRVDYDSSDELGDLSKTINFMAEELKKLEQARSGFLGNVSHELKTPLTIIKGFVITLLGSPGIPEEWEHSLELINRETDRLTRLVNELLELTRLRTGRVNFHFSRTDLREILVNVYTGLLPRAEHVGISLYLAIPPALPSLWADADRIKEVCINLIDNALKYCSNGGRVEVEALEKAENVEILVKDNGPGISSDELPYLFERFFRAGSPQKTKGTGLGLAIVKEIVEAHKGIITVSSTVGQGTTFTIVLPIRKDKIGEEEENGACSH